MHEEFSVGNRVSVQLRKWKQAHEGIVKARTATGYTVAFKGKVYHRELAPGELTAVLSRVSFQVHLLVEISSYGTL